MDGVRALEVVRVTKRVVYPARSSAAVSRSSQSAMAPTGSCVAIGASRTLPEASRTVSLHRDNRAPRGALAFSDAVVLD
jgi:hypothetical protein